MNDLKNALILMTTYNGEMYLEDQLNSIFRQTFCNWYLIVSDDGSTDNTLEILNRYKNIDKRIMEIRKNEIKQGAYNNYLSLMRYVKYNYCEKFDYFFYCDQDDIWDENKMAMEIKTLEGRKIALCFSDVEYIDKDGNSSGVYASNIRKMSVENKYDFLFPFRYTLGTSIAHSRDLWKMINLPSDLGQDLVQHDQYLRKICVLYGEIIYIPERLVKYRRHSSNVSKPMINYDFLSAIKKFYKCLPDIINNTARQFCEAEIILNNLEDLNESIADYRSAIMGNSLEAYRFIKKYKISISDNIYESTLYKILFYLRIYRLSKVYRMYKGENK